MRTGLKHHFLWVVNDPGASTLSQWTSQVFVLRLYGCGNVLSLFWGEHASARKCRLDHCVTITEKDERSRLRISLSGTKHTRYNFSLVFYCLSSKECSVLMKYINIKVRVWRLFCLYVLSWHDLLFKNRNCVHSLYVTVTIIFSFLK